MSITYEDIEKAEEMIKKQSQLYGSASYVININGTITVLDATDVDRVLAEYADTDSL